MGLWNANINIRLAEQVDLRVVNVKDPAVGQVDAERLKWSLIHFWPGNAIAVRARRPLPPGVWSNVTVTYDGSSRATGIRVYLNGAPLDLEIIADRLYKDITYDRSAGEPK